MRGLSYSLVVVISMLFVEVCAMYRVPEQPLAMREHRFDLDCRYADRYDGVECI